ncbi:hypothetical protein LINGRAHAP2_LOCUS35924 [Linum grandiflorum]
MGVMLHSSNSYLQSARRELFQNRDCQLFLAGEMVMVAHTLARRSIISTNTIISEVPLI